MPTPFASIVALSVLTGWQPSGMRWSTAALPVPFCIVGNAARTTLGPAQQVGEVARMVDAWRSSGAGGGLSCSVYDAVRRSAACPTDVDLGDRANAIFWEQAWIQGALTLALTHTAGSGSCGSLGGQPLTCTTASDIEFNDASTSWNDTGVGGNDVASIALHEYGHFIGLGHCDGCSAASSVMFAAYSGGLQRALFPDDVSGACALYPGSPGLCDVCLGPDECANDGACVIGLSPAAAEGRCVVPCTSASPCPREYTCATLPGGQSYCIPESRDCTRLELVDQPACGLCSGSASCAGGGACVRGLSPTGEGRCVAPCGPGGVCSASFLCRPIAGGDYCVPLSMDCTDLSVDQPLCGVCTGSPDCAGGGVCVVGLSPVANEGRCLTPCAMPGGGACPAGYTCAAVASAGDRCVPTSGDCRDPTPPADHCALCASSAECGGGACVVGVSPVPNEGRCLMPCPSPGSSSGGCPEDFACVDAFGTGQPFCVPRSSDCTDPSNSLRVEEGEVCPPGASCSVGVCLDDGTSPRCHRGCEEAPEVCTEAQACTWRTAADGGSVRVCEPAGARVGPDATADGGLDGGSPESNVDGADAGGDPRPDLPAEDASTLVPDAEGPEATADVSPGGDAVGQPCCAQAQSSSDCSCTAPSVTGWSWVPGFGLLAGLHLARHRRRRSRPPAGSSP